MSPSLPYLGLVQAGGSPFPTGRHIRPKGTFVGCSWLGQGVISVPGLCWGTPRALLCQGKAQPWALPGGRLVLLPALFFPSPGLHEVTSPGHEAIQALVSLFFLSDIEKSLFSSSQSQIQQASSKTLLGALNSLRGLV